MLVFLAPGILEDGFCGLFSYEFISFFETELFFQIVLVFLLQAFWKTVLLPFFHMNSKVFFEQNCFFNESVGFFGFRHFVRRFCGIFII